MGAEWVHSATVAQGHVTELSDVSMAVYLFTYPLSSHNTTTHTNEEIQTNHQLANRLASWHARALWRCEGGTQGSRHNGHGCGPCVLGRGGACWNGH